jgi:hypothetical protein
VLKGSDQNVIRLAAVTNDVFKPSKHDKNGSNGGPTPASFHRPPRAAPPADGEAPPPQPPPGTLLGPDGQE